MPGRAHPVTGRQRRGAAYVVGKIIDCVFDTKIKAVYLQLQTTKYNAS